MTAYYNEIDPVAAQWLRNLIAAGLIAPGDVDQRSIEDVRPAELMGYTQCHFFAGIGIWSYALRRAGWPDDRRVWTGSCPCQPFSTAGEGAGFADERHLWPAWFHLIGQCRPAKILGEQVASKDAEPWIDLVCADLGSLGYASGAIAFPAAGVGCPGIRDRLYWVADAPGAGLQGRGSRGGSRPGRQGTAAERGGADGGLAESGCERHDRSGAAGAAEGPECRRDSVAGHPSSSGGVDHTASGGFGVIGSALEPRDVRHVDGAGEASSGMGHAEHGGPSRSSDTGVGEGVGRAGPQPAEAGADGRPGPTNGFWRSADWLLCRDERWRPVEPGTFPLAARTPGDVGQLRAYGNGLNAEQARIFIESMM